MKNNMSVDFIVAAGKSVRGSLQVPGDKSISHRALMLGAIAVGQTRIRGFLDSEDTRATMHALQQMGVNIERQADDQICIDGRGLFGLQAPDKPLDLGNSGTSVRLFAGLLAGQHFASELCGDESLMQRPMQRIVNPLQQMGARIECSNAGLLPIKIKGKNKLKGLSYSMPVASAQLKSAILLAGLYAEGPTSVIEPALTRDHSERMLSYFGCEIEKNDDKVCLKTVKLEARDIDVPADISSAAFFMVAASIMPDSELLLENVGFNPTRHAVVEILQLMGADIVVGEERLRSGEPVADIRVRHAQLVGIDIPQALVPIAIDEFPVLMVAAAYAKGETRLSGAAELRIKESDRIMAMCEGLREIGIVVEEYEDGMSVKGGQPSAGEVKSYGDHRIAMAFAVAALGASAPITIRDCANVNTSFPGFSECFSSLGLVLNAKPGAVQ